MIYHQGRCLDCQNDDIENNCHHGTAVPLSFLVTTAIYNVSSHRRFRYLWNLMKILRKKKSQAALKRLLFS